MREEIKEIKEGRDKKTCLIRYWDSWAEWIEDRKKVSPCGANGQSQRVTGGGWDGTKNYEEAIALSQTGWIAGADKVRALSAPLIDEIGQRIQRPEYVYQVEGEIIDVARYIDGEPECFIRQEIQTATGTYGNRLIKIVYNGSVNCGVSSETMIKIGGAVVALVELLELAGNRVELIMSDCFSSYAHLAGEFHVKVKEFDQPLNLAVATFALANPASFRRLGFHAMECLPEDYRKEHGIPNGGYGHSGRDPEPERRGDIYLAAHDASHSANNIEGWLREKLKEQGVELREFAPAGSKEGATN